MAAVAFVGDAGQIHEVIVADANGNALDLTNTTLRQIKFLKPSGTEVVKTAVLHDGPNGKLRYTMATGDYDAGGGWRRRGYCEGLPNGLGNRHTEWFDFEVGV